MKRFSSQTIELTKRFPKSNLVLISLFALLFLWFSFGDSTSIVHCRDSNCSSSNIGFSSDTALLQNSEFTFRIPGGVKDYTGQNLANGQLNIFRNSGKRTLYIPMRDGSSPAFPVEIPETKHEDAIRLVVISSQSFSVFENDVVVYSHRYQTPVFFFSTSNPISTEMSQEIGSSHFRIDIKRKPSIQSSISSLLFVLLAASIGLAFTFLKMPKKRSKFPELGTIPLFPFIFLWVFSILKWVSKPNDMTGNLKPGPFGPIGPSFSDVFQVLQSGSNSKPYTFGSTDYPPFAVAFGQLTRFIPTTLVVFILLILTVILFCMPFRDFQFSPRIISKIKILLLLLFSYPIIFGLIRGNFDLLAIALTLTSIYEYRKARFLTSGIYLALAISLKYWPVLFLLIFLKEKRFKLTIKTILLAGFITILSCVFLNYRDVSQIFAVSTKSLLDYGTGGITLSSYSFSYSINSILFVIVLFFSSNQPFHPSVIELHHALVISQGNMRYLSVAVLVLAAIYLFRKFNTVSSIFLLVSCLTLVLTSISATYRGGILIACLMVRATEGDKSLWRFQDVGRQNRKVSKRFKVIKYLEAVTWLGILTPMDFYYQTGSFFSSTSLIQPISAIGLVIIEFQHLRATPRVKVKK